MQKGIVVFVAAAALAPVASAALTPLNLGIGRPDVNGSGISVMYNATTRQFRAAGSSVRVALAGDPTQGTNIPGNRLWEITALINNDGTLGGPGTLTVRGDFNSVVNDLLLSSTNLTQLGGSTSGNTLEFVFATGGGSLNPFGQQISVVLTNLGTTDITNFTATFPTSLPQAVGDAFVVPAPAPAALGLIGLGALARRRR